MSVLGRAYLGVSLIVFILGLIWFTLVLQENRAWVEVVLLVPRFDFVDPLIRKRFQMNVAAILAGWGGCMSLLLLIGIVAPFRIRSMALFQRRVRELEREILELRTLPLRQQEEDEILAAEAHLDIRAKKVMTEKLRRDRMLREDADGELDDDDELPSLAGAGFRPPSSARGAGSRLGSGSGLGSGLGTGAASSVAQPSGVGANKGRETP
ncbi:hypothetical protein [Enhygromyxa salina]|uniref:hypothetical protein n=1 Tax=Enhygromyxa salina TaxID=215803 RepID=UPI0011B1F54A|nr:hypothetical protein [Enhygromyxa salina]